MKKPRFRIKVFAVACFAMCLCHTQLFAAQHQDANSAGISFTISKNVLHHIDPRLFGQFMERPSWGEIGPEGARVPGTSKLQPDVMKLLVEMKIPILRFPGGTDADFLDWCDMVDNVPGRAAERPISTGHLGHKVTNYFGYDEFLEFYENIGAQAIIVVNFRDGLLKKKPLKEAAAHASALVAYCNAPLGAKLLEGMYDWPALRAKNGHPAPYKVKYFQIGNETWAFMKQLREQEPHAAPEFYTECMAVYIEAMRSVDPSIEIIVDGHDGDMGGIVPKMREKLQSKIAYFATHFYSPWGIAKVTKNGAEAPMQELAADEIWRAWVAVTQFDSDGQSIIDYPGINAARKLGYKVAITEWNWNGGWRHNGPKTALNSSWAKGLGAAGYLHAFMRAADVIEIGCQSMLVGNSWGITAIHADAEGKIPPFYMPTGQVTMFYSQHHGSELLALAGKNVPMYEQPYHMGGISPNRKVAYIDALASAGQKRIYFHAINRRFEESLDVTVDVSAFDNIKDLAVHHVLEGRLNDVPEPNEPRQVSRINRRDVRFDGKILKVTLPQRSVSCIEFTYD